jgi:hypothetical protein
VGDHTPGPWKWDNHGDLRGKDRNAVINPELRRDVLSAVNYEEDARLIAAAPDLLAALERIEDLDWSHDSAESAMVKVQVEAAAAIAKAKGFDIVAP